MSRYLPLPPAEDLRRVFDYDPLAGEVRWRVNGGARARAGAVAGTMSKGYVTVEVFGRHYKMARIIWRMVTGDDPGEFQIDHRDLARSNNRWENLRLATNSTNVINQPRRSNNKSGYKGVCWHKQRQQWYASITVNQKQKFLGLFDCPKEAHAAYLEAAALHHGEYARAN